MGGKQKGIVSFSTGPNLRRKPNWGRKAPHNRYIQRSNAVLDNEEVADGELLDDSASNLLSPSYSTASANSVPRQLRTGLMAHRDSAVSLSSIAQPTNSSASDVYSTGDVPRPYKRRNSSALGPKQFKRRCAQIAEVVGGTSRVLDHFQTWLLVQGPDTIMNFRKSMEEAGYDWSEVYDSEDPYYVDKAIALMNDLLLSARQYELLTKHRSDLPKYHRVLARMKETDIELVSLLKSGVVAGDAVKYILRDVIVPELVEYLREGGELRHLEYKHGGDNFSKTTWSKRTIQNEQYLFYLLVPEKKTNSILRARPIAFCYDQGESKELMDMIFAHVDPQLPRDGFSVTVRHPTTGEDVVFTLQDYLCCDYALAAYVMNFDGQKGTWKCLWGASCSYSLDSSVPAGEYLPRTQRLMRALGNLNMRCQATFTDPNLLKQDVAKHKQLIDMVWECQGLAPPKWANWGPGRIAEETHKACRNQKGPPCTHCEPLRTAPDSCHLLISLGKNWRGIFLTAMARQVGANLRAFEETVAGEPYPMMGWNALRCKRFLTDPASTNALFAEHPLHSEISEANDLLSSLSTYVTQELLTTAEIDDFEVKAKRLSFLWEHVFGSYAKYVEYCSSTGKAPSTLPHISFTVNTYEHAIIVHVVPWLRRHGSLIRYSSWVCEALNKVWKQLLAGRTTEGGGTTHESPGKQALRIMLRLSHPLFRRFSLKYGECKSERSQQVCGFCNQSRTEGHSRNCYGC